MLKTVLMEQAAHERSVCLSSFQSKRSQSRSNAEAGQRHVKAEPFPQRKLKKMGKDISALNPLWPEL